MIIKSGKNIICSWVTDNPHKVLTEAFGLPEGTLIQAREAEIYADFLTGEVLYKAYFDDIIGTTNG